ncbi:ABC transporter substrate-binding protein [Burkholderia sp. WSM2232]|uniref:ABC transporter substrate-binding protein n=1 Tax=Burkholderia sp. WSM2232 TaxID=944436 RepID=UPI0003FAE1B5|nr:ABC transporter substrate-binding protein [Burkholderia sp. WSM2232]
MSNSLSIVLGPHGQVQDLKSGAVPVEGFDLVFTEVKRMPDVYREMARSQPYDVCEMAPTSYLMARAAGAPLTALPLPMTRRFRHGGVQRLRHSIVRNPKDLEGRGVGVRTYSVTAAVWTRGIYADEYGLDPDKVTWLTQEEENVASFALPPNVNCVGKTALFADLLRAGQLDAVFAGLAGGAEGLEDELVDLVDDAPSAERSWFERTGIYPLHGVIVMRNEVLAAHPHLPAALFEAFGAAKRNYLARVQSGEVDGPEDQRYRKLAAFVGDPLPYGVAENRASFAALVRYAHRQRLIDSLPSLDEVVLDPQRASQHHVQKVLA